MTTQLERIGEGLAPPHSIEAEESVLGAVMLSPDAANVALESLRVDDFYKPAHQSIFEAVTKLFDASEPIDAITVSDHLRRTEQLDRIGGVEYLTRLIDAVPTTSNVAYYSEIVEETASRRRLMRAGSEVVKIARQSDRPIEEVLDSAEAEVFAVADRKLSEGLAPVGPMLQDALERIEEIGARGEGITGTPTGFVDLDDITAGLHPANLVVVAARPGMGKSTFALNVAANVADKEKGPGLPVAVFTLEMSKEEIVQRLLASLARVDSSKIRNGQLDAGQWQKLTQASAKLYSLPFFIDDSSDVTVTAIRAKCRRMKRREGLGLVIVDYLQLMQGPRNVDSRQQEIADISRSLKNLARELHVPIIAVSQLNRQLEARENKRPRLGDLRESGAIEQDADIVLFLYREGYYDRDSDQRGIAEMEIAKHRAGRTDRLRLNYFEEYSRFDNLTKRQAPM